MSKNRKLPIVIGHLKDNASDKAVIAAKTDDSVKIAICRLKDDKEAVSGAQIEVEDIEGIIQEFWICRKQSLKVLIDTLQKMYDTWE